MSEFFNVVNEGLDALSQQIQTPRLSFLPTGPYQVILADPPWHYNDRRVVRKDGKIARAGWGAANNYPTMKTKEICELPVREIAAENCALFLWATPPNLEDALQVIKAWGFRYVTFGFIWEKVNRDGSPWFGVGYYSKSNTEPCLLAVKGRMKPVSNAISQVIRHPHLRYPEGHPRAGKIVHSGKPTIVRDKIVELCGDVPRVELFSRQRAAGWDGWGFDYPGESPVSQAA